LVHHNGVYYAEADRMNSRPESALEILKQRYAKGEKSREEYDRIKRDLA
jgi:uncharacterized membrane protein